MAERRAGPKVDGSRVQGGGDSVQADRRSLGVDAPSKEPAGGETRHRCERGGQCVKSQAGVCYRNSTRNGTTSLCACPGLCECPSSRAWTGSPSPQTAESCRHRAQELVSARLQCGITGHSPKAVTDITNVSRATDHHKQGAQHFHDLGTGAFPPPASRCGCGCYGRLRTRVRRDHERIVEGTARILRC